MKKRSILALAVTATIASLALVPAASASASTASFANPQATASTTDFDIPSADVSYDLNGITIALHTENVTSASGADLQTQLSLVDRQAVSTTANDFNLYGAVKTSTSAPKAVSFASQYNDQHQETKLSAPDVTVARDASANTVIVSIPRKYVFWSGDIYLYAKIQNGSSTQSFEVSGDATSITTVGPVAAWPMPTVTTATLSSANQTYGATPATLTAAVTPALPGTFTVLDGATPVASGPTSTGSASIALPVALASGPHSISVSFTPSDGADFAVSASAPIAFSVISVAKSTKTKMTFSKKSQVFKKKPAKVAVSVSRKAVGTVTLYDGKKKLKTVTLKKGKAHYSFSKKLRKGTHKIKAVFAPTNREAFASSTSKTVILRVKR